MPLRFAGRWRKSWRYVGAYGENVMLCAANVHVGPLGQTFWALLDRSAGEILESTHQLLPAERGEVWTEKAGGYEAWDLGTGGEGIRTRIESNGSTGRMRFRDPGEWVEAVCPTGDGKGSGGFVWTRKRPSTIEVDLKLADGRRIKDELRGIEDESAGYHPRHTSWHWSAGVGTAADGREVAWNLVEGVNDPERGSERAIWVAGEDPSEPARVVFDELEGITFTGGARLDFTAEAERRADESKLIVKSSYRQPFGTFSGSLDGVDLAAGIGVMESHEATW
jgi:Domain of unknown function (DUF2804), C-terminal